MTSSQTMKCGAVASSMMMACYCMRLYDPGIA